MQDQETNHSIILRTPEDWLLWSDQFQSKAKRAQIWRFIHQSGPNTSPTTDNAFSDALKIPEKPKLSLFKKKNTNGTRSAIEASALADLVTEDLALWSALKAEYAAEVKEHEQLLKKIDALQDWVRETVAIEHLRLYCTADREIDEWYYALQARLATDNLDRKARARKAYDNALAAPRRKRLANKREVEEWLLKWDAAYHELIQAGYKDPKEASLWFADYTEALSHSCYDSWIYSYHSSHISEIRKNTLVPSEVLLDTRFFLNSIRHEDLPTRGRVTKGAFGPTIAEGEASHWQAEDTNTGALPSRRSRGRGYRGRGPGQQGFRQFSGRDSTPRGDRSPSVPAKRRNDEEEKRPLQCEACGFRGHPFFKCWYLFEKERPSGWMKEEDIHEAIQKRLLADDAFASRMPRQGSSISLNTSIIYPEGLCATRFSSYTPGDYLWAGTSQVAIDGYGSVKVRLTGAKGTYITLRLDDVVYCEKFASNLVSFSRLRRRGIWWDTSPGNNCLRRSDHSLIGSLEEVHNQQVIEYRPLAEEPTAEAVMTAASSDTDIPRRALRNAYTSHTRRKPIRGSELTWHHRLGHPGPDAIRRLANASRGVRLTVGDRVTTTTCSACAQGKMKRQVRRSPRESLSWAKPGERLAIDFHDFEQGYAGYSLPPLTL
ncbi:hypothetical protein Forpe1208_v009686 [Fusarium oxysporum f. sp. rapae]|uniref:GAG-pre-integrase domain-containing protein n=1 Tax=Fusarium oxysporum f. sp. rapae TaxID=485398 RepID=A0A8J5U5S0_FUSOX|nr:hypothetical protein Forpe1208_v009686 [Fusarium oxysporum f. sp. rapae]